MMGSQEPSERIAPEYRATDGPDAVRILRAGGTVLDPWQSDILDDWMGRTVSGKWTAPTAGGSVPRQNGKSLLVQGRAASGMLMFNETVIYTAHLQKTATETFEEMRAFFEGPKMRRYVSEIRTALGREQIILKSGAKIKFLARTRNGGRGQHGDLLIFDEAQELDETAQGSFIPAISASLNPQTIYVGTPPGPDAVGTVFRALRKRALDGEAKKAAWFEFSVPEIGDVKDPARWAAANPALGRRIQYDTIEGESEQLDADTFARERLGWWSPVAAEHLDYALDRKAWAACASEDEKPEGKTAYGVKFAADGSAVCLCGAVIPKEGPARVSLIDLRPTGQGLAWLADWLCDRYGKASCVVIDGRNGVDVLVERIREVWKAKNAVVRPGARDVIAAVSLFTNAVSEGGLTWYAPQTALNESAVTATKRPLAGGFGFGGENSLPVEACALALWGAKTCRDELKYGCTFATLSGDNAIGCNIRFHSPATAAALWSGEKGRIDCGLAIVDTVKDEHFEGTWRPSVVNFYTDDTVIVLNSHGSFWTAQRHAHKMGRPLMEPLIWNATNSKPFGRSRLKKPIRALIDDYIRTAANATIALEFATTPQKYILGVTDEQYDAIISNKFKTYMGAIIAATANPETGENPTLGQLAQGSLTPHVEKMRMTATQFAAATGLTVTDVGVVNDANPTSSDAILAQSQTLVLLAQQLNTGNGDALRTIACMAQAVARDCRLADLTEEETGIMAHFKNPAMPSVAVTADAAIKIASARQEFASTDTFLEMIGFDQADIRRIKAQEQRARGAQVLMEMEDETDTSGMG